MELMTTKYKLFNTFEHFISSILLRNLMWYIQRPNLMFNSFFLTSDENQNANFIGNAMLKYSNTQWIISNGKLFFIYKYHNGIDNNRISFSWDG